MTLQIAGEQVADLAITTAKLAANAVTAAKAKLDEVWAFASLPTCATAPSTDSQFANKAYVDSVAQGLDVHASVRATTTDALETCTYSGSPNFILTKTGNGALPAQDGQTLTQNQRLLVKDQADAKQNGIYTLTTVGDVGTPWVLTRAADQNASAEFSGAFTFVEDGTVMAGSSWVCNVRSTFVLDTNDVVWALFAVAGGYVEGNGIDITGVTISAVVESGKGLSVGASGLAISLESNKGLALGVNGLAGVANAAAAMAVGAGGFGVAIETDHGLEFHATTGSLALKVEANKGLTFGASGLAGVANAAAAMAVGASGFGVALEADHGLEFHATTGSLAAKLKNTTLSMDASGLFVYIGDDSLYESTGLRVKYSITGALTVGVNGLEVLRTHETKAWNGNGNTFVLSHTPDQTLLIVTLNGIILSYDATPEQGEYSITTNTITLGGYTDVPSGYKTEVWYVGW